MTSKQVSILFLDDELENLSSFKAAFRRRWNVFVTSSAEEAYELLDKNEIQIVISDQRMPEISGVEFLSKVKETYPDSIRMLLTGYADMDAVIQAINKGNIYKYFTKPWNADILNEAFSHCSELFENKKEIRTKNQELALSHQELESFVYSASHDLRAPLVSILGVIKLARAQEARGETQLDYLTLIENSVDSLDKFVRNIINYYQNRKQEKNIRKIDLDYLIDEVYANFKHYDGADEISFEKTIDAKADLYTDELRIKIILNNLISNAIKYHDYSKDNQIVKVKATIDSEQFEIQIEDNGKGISDKQKDKVFDMFFTGTNGKSIGTGIGLHIVKEAVNKLGGEIHLVTAEGEGSTFTLRANNANGESD